MSIAPWNDYSGTTSLLAQAEARLALALARERRLALALEDVLAYAEGMAEPPLEVVVTADVSADLTRIIRDRLQTDSEASRRKA